MIVRIFKHKKSTISMFNDDCLLAIPKVIEPQTVDVVITSPPYNIGTKYNSYDDTIERDKYLQWTNKWLETVKSAMHEGASLFLNVGSKPTDPFIPHDVLYVARKHFVLQNTFHWIKSISLDNPTIEDQSALTSGHYKPINSKRFVNDCHEYIFHLTKTGNVEIDRLAIGVKYKDQSNIERWGGNTKRCRGNTWFIPYVTVQNKKAHPASFPVLLPQFCILLHGEQKANLIMDPFVGSGTTALACLILEKSCLGFEIDEHYYSISNEEISNLIMRFHKNINY